MSSDKWARPVNLAVSFLMIVFGSLTWRVGSTLMAVLFWAGAALNLVYEAFEAVRSHRRQRDPLPGSRHPSTTGSRPSVTTRARWSVFKSSYLAALPLLLLASADRVRVGGVDVLGNGLIVLALVLLSFPGKVLRQWVEEADRRDDYLFAGLFMSVFCDHSLRLAGWEWPWFNRVRIGVAVLGLAGWAVALSGSALFGWS